jgi:hypothetical protein
MVKMPLPQTTAPGHLRLSTPECSFVFRRLRPHALLVSISGHDRGELGTGPLDEIRMELLRSKPLELFVDARAATGAAVSVSNEWTKFFATHKHELKRVSVLVGSKVMNLTVAIAQHLSRTGNLIQIYSDPELFEARVAESSPS